MSVVAPSLARSNAGPTQRLSSRLDAKYSPYLFVAPFFLLFLTFQLVPILWTVGISFTEWNGLRTPELIGLDNFTRLGRDPQFRAAFGNTIFYWVTGVLVIPIAIAIAVVLNSPRLKAAPLVKTIFFLPYVTATIAIGLVFRILFDAQAGTLNAYLGLFGIEPVGWLTSTGLAKIPVAILFIWRHLPWYALIILSGLMVIPKDYYEAARIDGANAWRQFWHITLPSLRPILVFAFINLTVDSWNIFAEPYILPGPGTSTVSLFQYLYVNAFSLFQFGYASSIGLVLVAVLALASATQFQIFRRTGGTQ